MTRKRICTLFLSSHRQIAHARVGEAILSLQLHRGNSSTGRWHLTPPTRNQERHSIKASLVWGQGGYVHRCWSGKGDLLAQTIGSRAGPWPKVHWWPPKNLVRVTMYTFPPHALPACPLCEEEGITSDSFLSHILTIHSRSSCNSDKLLLSVSDSDSVLFYYLCSLANLFWILIYFVPCMSTGPLRWTFEPLKQLKMFKMVSLVLCL